MSLQTSTPHHDASQGSELLPQHGTNADKHQLIAGGNSYTSFTSACDAMTAAGRLFPQIHWAAL